MRFPRRGEVVPVRRHLPVVQAEHSLGVGEGLLVQRDRLAQPPRRLVDSRGVSQPTRSPIPASVAVRRAGQGTANPPR